MGILVLKIHQIENLWEGKCQVISKFLTQAAKGNGVRDRGPDWRIKNLAWITFSSNCWTPSSGQRSSLDRFRSLGWRCETSQRMELGLRNSIGTAFKFWLFLWNHTFNYFFAKSTYIWTIKALVQINKPYFLGEGDSGELVWGCPIGRPTIHRAKHFSDSGDGQFVFNGNSLKLGNFSWEIGYLNWLVWPHLKTKVLFLIVCIGWYDKMVLRLLAE